ncbi:hypothetical protein A9Q98_08485 [Thalassotalea sp. 42_200_T64]|nr:hypothetical protein A9Q98_08485 [Thalassotalea sp. 42_200_T64]
MKLTTKASVLATIIAAGVLTMATASASIVSSKHNLGSNGTGANNLDSVTGTGDATEVCVFCHTPHGANTGISAPLWNKTAGTGSYSTYSDMASTTIDGRIETVGSVSVACLSCHDGSQAMDVMSNESGSGADTISAFDWTGSTGTTATNGKLVGFAAITTDSDGLKNDHPVGIQYAGGGYTSTDTSATSGAAMVDGDFNGASYAKPNGVDVWWVNTTATDSTANREKTDMILYTRTGSGTGLQAGIQPYVECATCHDPHEASNKTFLRIPNTDSKVCLACHDK